MRVVCITDSFPIGTEFDSESGHCVYANYRIEDNLIWIIITTFHYLRKLIIYDSFFLRNYVGYFLWMRREKEVKKKKTNQEHFKYISIYKSQVKNKVKVQYRVNRKINPYPTAFPYGNGMVLHFYQQQESSTTKTVHKVINKGLKTYV